MDTREPHHNRCPHLVWVLLPERVPHRWLSNEKPRRPLPLAEILAHHAWLLGLLGRDGVHHWSDRLDSSDAPALLHHHLLLLHPWSCRSRRLRVSQFPSRSESIQHRIYTGRRSGSLLL